MSLLDDNAAGRSFPLGRAARGFRGTIVAIAEEEDQTGLPRGELQLRLTELGLTEGARVEILHQGIFRRDPIAVRVDGLTVALRRREAMVVWVDAQAGEPI